MAVYDILTGNDISVDGGGPGYKCMCLNCEFCKQTAESMNTTEEQFTCDNPKVLETGRKKIMDAVPDGFEVKALELGPMKLKNPTKKCPNHNFDFEKVNGFLSNFLNPTPCETEHAQ